MKISIITVCLDAERYLEQQLASVSSQSWRDLEQIVVDGGSTDRTAQIVQRAAQAEPRLRWSSGPDRGIGDAMNKGLALATGDVVGFLHADDFYAEPSVLQKVADAFAADPATEWVTGGIRYVDSRGELITAYAPRRWSYRRLLRGNILFHPATFVRREVLQSVGGFDPALRYTMDYDLWLRLGRRSAPRQLDLPIACFRVHPHSTSVRHIDAAFREEFQVRCRYLAGKPLQRALHLLYFALKFLPNRWSMRHGAA